MSWLLLLVPAAVLAWSIIAYNRFVRLRNQVRTAWADVDVQLMRRHDLVPQLVAAVKGYASHEQAVLEHVARLRAEAQGIDSPSRLGEVERSLEAGITRLLALREAYPDLKASENFAQLQRDLVDVENQLQFARRFYNGAVRDYNNTLQRLPDTLLAGPLGFEEAEFFQAQDAERSPVAVRL